MVQDPLEVLMFADRSQLSYCRNRRKEASWPPDLSVPTQDCPQKMKKVGVQKNVFHLVRTLHVKLMCFRTVCQIPSDGYFFFFISGIFTLVGHHYSLNVFVLVLLFYIQITCTVT